MRYRSIPIRFAKELRQEGHTRKFSIKQRGCDGWEVREEQDDRVLKQICYTDCHCEKA